MNTQLEEHDYIGLSGTPPMGCSGKVAGNREIIITEGLNMKATELRLGLPGTDESPEKDISFLKGFVSGAKRVHSDANNRRSGKWVFSGGDEIFSPRGVNGGGNGKDVVGCDNEYQKETIPLSPNPTPEKKPPISAKTQVVGWPPIRSFRKNSMAGSVTKNIDESEVKLVPNGLYVKVGMDGAPYLRKVDLKIYSNYTELSLELEKMFSCFKIGECESDGVSSSCDGLTTSSLKDLLLHGSEYMLTYEDKDGDWMLVGDVPWAMFINTCRRMRIMKRSDANGLGPSPRAGEKCKNRG